MAVEVLSTGGYYDGDGPLDPTTATTVVGGMPAAISATGYKETTSPSAFAGLFKSTSVDEVARSLTINDVAVTSGMIAQAADATHQGGAQLALSCTIIKGACKVRFYTDGLDASPFVWPGTTGGGWAVGDKIYVNSGGKWDNAVQTARDVAFGRVVKAATSATDDMIVDFWGAIHHTDAIA